MNDFDIDTDFWHEINDMPGEIFDIPEMQDVMVDFEKSLNSDEDFWSWCLLKLHSCTPTTFMILV